MAKQNRINKLRPKLGWFKKAEEYEKETNSYICSFFLTNGYYLIRIVDWFKFLVRKYT